jgi:hypothetical protein
VPVAWLPPVAEVDPVLDPVPGVIPPLEDPAVPPVELATLLEL